MPASSLVVFLGKALNEIVSTFELLDCIGSNRWQLDWKVALITSLSPGRRNLANQRAKQ